MKKITVMVVDDDIEFLSELEDMLRLSNYAVKLCRDGSKALDMARALTPDVILLDLKMNGKSGFQVATELSRLRETSGIPIIAMTAYYTKSDYEFLMKRCGLKSLLEKPLKPLELISEIEKFGR